MQEEAMLEKLLSNIEVLRQAERAEKVVHAEVKLGALVPFSLESFGESFAKAIQGTSLADCLLKIHLDLDPTHPDANGIHLLGIEVSGFVCDWA